jgi:DUF2934 family protein
MARPRNPKKGDAVNPAVTTSTASAAGSTAAAETTPAMAAEPSTVQPAAAKQETKNAKNGGARKPENGKPEIVKKETRANLIPINLDDEIRRLAYLLSERRGFEPGHDAEDWLNAEREVLQRYHQQSA